VAYMHRLDKNSDPESAVLYLEFLPSYEACLGLSKRGALTSMRIVGDMARIEHDYKQDEALFNNLSLGTFVPATGSDSGPVKTGACVATFTFKIPIACLIPSPDGVLLLVGLASGVVCVLDASYVAALRMVHAMRFHEGTVLALTFNSGGDAFASLGAERVVFVRGADFKVLGYADHSHLPLGDAVTGRTSLQNTA
jgi:WD40 repeat protein